MGAYSCQHCGGSMKIIAFVIQASEIKLILELLGLPTEAPILQKARGQDSLILVGNWLPWVKVDLSRGHCFGLKWDSISRKKLT
jgi:hypothetical protein